LPSDLPEGLPKPRQTHEAPPEHDEQAAQGQHNGESDSPERRHKDRRQKNSPTTLDTRLTQARRRSAGPAPISIEI